MLLSDQPFWEKKTLATLTKQEWESLCDGCGKCCLIKLEDIDDGEVYYTSVACQYLNTSTCRCTVYPQRFKKVPACTSITIDNIHQLNFLPETCAYRRVAENKPLPNWHPLLCNNTTSMHKANASVKNKAISENKVSSDNLEDYIIDCIVID